MSFASRPNPGGTEAGAGDSHSETLVQIQAQGAREASQPPTHTAFLVPMHESTYYVSTMRIHFLLLSLLAISLSCSGAAPPPVRDTDGHELSSGASYYVLPAVRGRGGGLTMAPHGLRCPLYVALEANELRRGFPVRFRSVQQGSGGASPTTVRVSSDVRIHFDALTTCVQTTEWHLVSDGRSAGRVATGPIRAPSPSGREKVFRVEKHGRGYKLMSCKDKCQDLGVIREDRAARVWLGASDRAHEVVFKKAPPV